MKMNDFVTRTSVKEIRSSAFLNSQGSRFGATSSKSFEQRQAVDRRTAKIRAYRDSKLAQSRFSNQANLSKSANSSLQAIRGRRVARENSSNEFLGRDRQK